MLVFSLRRFFLFFLFKSCFKKDKKCTDTLIRHKQISCTNHISLDCLKKIAIRILTMKSVRGYLFLEIFFFLNFFVFLRPILENSCCFWIGRATGPLLSHPARHAGLTGCCPFFKLVLAATAKIQPLQRGLNSSWSGFGVSPCWLKNTKQSYTKQTPPRLHPPCCRRR